MNGAGVDDVWYSGRTLVSNNTVYNNGGKGIQVFRSAHVDVLNNTAYDNNLDPWESAIPRGEINFNGVIDGKVYNNVAIPVPATSASDSRCHGASYGTPPYVCPLMSNVSLLAGNSNGAGAVVDSGNSFLNNVTQGGTVDIWGTDKCDGGIAMFDGDYFPFACTSNKIGVSAIGIPDLMSNNFIPSATSPVVGYALTNPALNSDSGACDHTLTGSCP
ncbi:MAG TPA: right-handed parallel beta-helix repeat-containing protein [Candidatus Saccharimonadales bacterium]|nr:right-handed parallel beta-helix repeat-containing protein [Candidatus Saccharimonadales bacterium]